MTDITVETPTQDATPAQEPSSQPEAKQVDPQAPEGEEGTTEPALDPAETKRILEVQNKKIARQTAANREQQRQLQEAKARIAEYEAKLAASTQKDPLADKPNQDAFDSVEDYADALADWKLAQKSKEAEAKAKEPNVDEIVKQKLEIEKANLDFKTKEDAFRKVQPDYDKATQVVNGLLKHVDPNSDSTKAFASSLLNAPNPPAIVHYLGIHPDVAIAMMQMSPFEIQEQIGEIIDQLDAPKAETSADADDEAEGEETEAPKAKLPEPPSALKGGAKVGKPLHLMTPKELVKWSEGKK